MKKNIILVLIGIIVISCSSGPQTFEEFKKEGVTAFAREKYTEARSLLLKAYEKNQSDRDVLYYLGLAYQKDMILDSAVLYLKKADMLFSKDREINLAIYQVSLDIQEWELAIKAIDVLVETGDPIEDYYELLVDLNSRAGRDYAAFLTARKLLNSDLENVSNYILSANMASRIDSIDYALETIDKAIDKFGPKEEFTLNKAIYFAQAEEFKKSERLIRKLLTTSEEKSFIKLNLARVLALQDNRDKKMEAYNLYKEIKPKVEGQFPIDSLMNILKAELDIFE